jgi:hypothetical protein
MPLLAPTTDDDRTPKWYGFADDTLLEQMSAVDKAFADNGHASADLHSFIERMRQELNEQKKDLPF